MPLFPAIMKKIQLKMKALDVHNISPIVSQWGFFQTLKGSLLRSPWSDLAEFRPLPRLTVVLVTSKNEKYPIKNEVASVFTTLYIDFSDAQGQVTP